MKEFKEDWYDQKYFSDKKGKKFTRTNGTIEYWGYRSETGEIGGGPKIIESWKKMFNPKTMLAVGCGRGAMVAYAREKNIQAQGFDWSKYAVSDEGRYKKCKQEWIQRHNVTKPWPYPDNSFDLVVALDLWEHIYATDLDFAISEMYRVAKKWIFLEIATVDGIKEQGYILKKGDPIPLAADGRTWAGHVYVTTPNVWIEKLDHDDWMLQRGMTSIFFKHLLPATIPNWLQNTVLVYKKLE